MLYVNFFMLHTQHYILFLLLLLPTNTPFLTIMIRLQIENQKRKKLKTKIIKNSKVVTSVGSSTCEKETFI